MVALFDLGNSRVKWTMRNAAGVTRAGALSHDAAGFGTALRAQLRGLPAVERVLVASVAGARTLALVQEIVREIWHADCVVLQSQAEQCGVQNAYRQPAQLGVDRWLALIAAWNRLRRPVCVVDAGTAVTVDVVAADGRHRGGLIVPGFDLACALLESRTAGIRAGEGSPAPALGDSTASCVANGALLGVLGMVNRALDIMGAECEGDGVLVVTGGSAPALLPHLPRDARHVPDLVFEGMELVDREHLP